jgi:hypothetical protein
MAKTRRKKPAPATAAKPATTLMDFTERGIDALRTNRPSPAQPGRSNTRDDNRRAFEDAIERLKADYAEVLRRRD